MDETVFDYSMGSTLLRGLDMSIKYVNLPPKTRLQVFVVSDLHADAAKGLDWVNARCLGKSLDKSTDAVPEKVKVGLSSEINTSSAFDSSPSAPQKEDDNTHSIFRVILVPGDIASDLSRIHAVLSRLNDEYDLVSYIPGNHEAWLQIPASMRDAKSSGIESGKGDQMPNNSTSIDKLNAVLRTAEAAGARVGPACIKFFLDDEGQQSQRVWLLPLHAWYHTSWDREPELTDSGYLNLQRTAPFGGKWIDFSMCSWPPELIRKEDFVDAPLGSASRYNPRNDSLAKFFTSINNPMLSAVNSDRLSDDLVISFSHFLPRQELCPEKRYLLEPMLMKVIGSDYLESQLRELRPNLHLFGHTHIPIDLTLDGIRYCQWPLGYFREFDKQCAPIFNEGPLLVLDNSSTSAAEQKHAPSEVTNTDCGNITGEGSVITELAAGVQAVSTDPPKNSTRCILPPRLTHWTEHYLTNGRTPSNLEPAPWLAERIEYLSNLR